VTVSADSLLQFIRRVAVPRGDSTDDELLARFAADRDESAFAALVGRHGPMVLRVCQRVLGNAHDAEDAFQAAFLVLARKAGSAGRPRLLAHWLYGVAYRTALKARTERVTRQVKERQAEPRRWEAPVDPAWSDLRPVLDEEIRHLPRKYRVPFVLCYLEGKTNEEAARLIGCPKGTVLSRLAWARERLRSRLVRRGVGLSAGLLATLLLSESVASAVVPALLVDSTAKAAAAFAAGRAVAGRVASLAEGVLRAMWMSKVRTAAFAVAVALAAAFAGVLTHSALADKPPGAKPQEPVAGERRIPFHQAPVSGDDIVAVTGLDVYKFQLDIPKGEKFEVTWGSVDSKVPWYHDFTKEEDGPVTLRVSFLRLDRKMAGWLFSQEKEAEFRLDCAGCNPSFIGSVVANPLAGIPATEKHLIVVPSDKAWTGSKSGPTRLLAVVHSKPGVPVGSIDAAYPRAELTVRRVPKGE
jgi:RNA polymerase sigma factor (sigma-70 family)